MNEYLLDGEPITWLELISRADKEGCFCEPGLKRTSEAVTILRNAGHTVTRNRNSNE